MHPDSSSDGVGVLIQDKNFHLGQEIRQALRQGKVLLLRKKQRFDYERWLAAREAMKKNNLTTTVNKL